MCDTADAEPGAIKVALYVGPIGEPTHMARQRPSGVWTSKCGMSEDIDHARLEDVGAAYGTVSRILRRPGAERSPGEVQEILRRLQLGSPTP